MTFAPIPVGWPGLAALIAGGIAFVRALVAARRRRGPPDPGAGRRSRRSWLGIAIQGLAYAIVSFGAIRVTLPAASPAAVAQALLVALLIGAAVWLFVAATRVMGASWALEARTRSDHRLATTGPFALVRHPIYLGMGCYLVALAVALGHPGQLLPALPLFALGTWLRIRDEEALLRAQFGAAYDAWAARTKRFIPGIF